jgi:hypothetical protein
MPRLAWKLVLQQTGGAEICKKARGRDRRYGNHQTGVRSDNMSKYHSKKVTINGITYDSRKEARRHRELLLLERAGAITDLQRQVEFELIPAQREPDTIGVRGGVKKGKTIELAVKYVADFVYKENGKQVVEDTKGFKTKDYILKRKMMLYFHGIRIKEI